MQHGTGREAALDLIENVEATLARWGGRPYRDLIRGLRVAVDILQNTPDLDEPGRFARDYGLEAWDAPRVTKAERDEAIAIAASLEWRGQ